MPPTPQQQQAITTEGRPLLVEAGAGTGKTWVLVERFLHLLGGHPDWPIDAIIAVTFTEKAAREMRSRIRSGIEARALVAPAGGSHWHQRRRDLDRLQVGTIHSLCARILRENAIAAGIDPRFAVLDEQEADLLKEEAVRQALGGLVESPSLAGLLGALRVNDLREELLTLLNHRGTVYELFHQLPSTAELLDRWRQGLAWMQAGLWQEQIQAAPDLLDVLADLATLPIADPTDKLAPSVLCAQEGYRCVQAGDYPGAAQQFLQINRTGGKGTSWGSKEALQQLKANLALPQEAGKALAKSGCLASVGPEDERAAAASTIGRSCGSRLRLSMTV